MPRKLRRERVDGPAGAALTVAAKVDMNGYTGTL